MGLSNDFSTQCMVSWDVYPAIVPDEASVHSHATIVVEGASDGIVPEVNISGGGLYVLMGLLHGRHDHCFEVFQRQDYYLVVVILSLVVISLSRKKVCLFVGGAGFMMEGEMIFR